MPPMFATLVVSLATLTGAAGPDVPAPVADDVKVAAELDGVPKPSLEERVAELEASLAMASPQNENWKVYWKDGFRFEAPDGQHKLRFGGRIQNDWGWFSGDDAYDLEDGSEFRRARLFFEGAIYENVEFKAQYDFAGGDADWKDVWIGLKDTAIGTVRVGQMFEPFGLESQTSSNYTTFMERSLTDSLSPARNTGLLVQDNVGDTFNWAVGVFRPSDDDGDANDADGEYSFTGRIVGRPTYEDGGERLLHLGLALSLMSDDDGTISYAARPEQHLVDEIATSTAILADGAKLAGFEAAWVGGPLSFQGEYAITEVDDGAGDDPTYSAWYVYASWFLTGEHRAYKTSTGLFDAVTPNKNYGEQGCGAWELGLRYSTIDFDDGPSSDELSDITLGLNWYLNRNTKVMLNYVRSSFEDGAEDADADLFGVRFQVFF